MARFGDKEIAKERFYAPIRPIKICDVNVDNIVFSKLVKTKTNYKYFIGYLEKAIRPLHFIMPKMSGYVKAFKVKEGNNKVMSFHKMMRSYKKSIKLFGLRLN